jgi:hypothetical protein
VRSSPATRTADEVLIRTEFMVKIASQQSNESPNP